MREGVAIRNGEVKKSGLQMSAAAGCAWCFGCPCSCPCVIKDLIVGRVVELRDRPNDPSNDPKSKRSQGSRPIAGR